MQALKEQAAKGGDDVQVYWLKAAYRVFCFQFAQCLLVANQVSLRYDSSTPSLEEDPAQQLLSDQLPDGARLRQGCPLQESSDHSWHFFHASLGDYFMTTSPVRPD